MQDVGNALLVARVNAGLTLRQASRVSGVHKDVISRVERGIQHPTPLTVGRLARAYGRDAGEFLGGEEEREEGARRAARLREIREQFTEYADGLNSYCKTLEKKLKANASTQQDVDQFVFNLQLARPAMGRVLVDELHEIADALGMAERVGRQVLSGVSKDRVNASIDAQLSEHSVVLPALQRYYAVGYGLAKAAGDRENAETIRSAGRALPGVAA